MRPKRLTYSLENGSSAIAINLCYANVAMWECVFHCFFHSSCHCHRQLVLLFLLLHLLLLIQLLTMFLTLLCTLIVLYTGADITIVGSIIVLNNPTFSAAMGASVVVTQLELMEHIILL